MLRNLNQLTLKCFRCNKVVLHFAVTLCLFSAKVLLKIKSNTKRCTAMEKLSLPYSVATKLRLKVSVLSEWSVCMVCLLWQ